MIAMTCPENVWPADGFEKFIAHNEKIEVGLMLSVNSQAKIDRPAIQGKIMTALLECTLPAGNA